MFQNGGSITDRMMGAAFLKDGRSNAYAGQERMQ